MNEAIRTKEEPWYVGDVKETPVKSIAEVADEIIKKHNIRGVPKVLFRRCRPEALEWAPSTPNAACWDVYACLNEPVTLQPGQRAVIPTGWNVIVPHGWFMELRPRSGLAYIYGVTVLNTPGTVDSDYAGFGPDFEVKVILQNNGADEFTVYGGNRIAQARLCPVWDWSFEHVEDDEFGKALKAHNVERQGGFGSTGR